MRADENDHPAGSRPFRWPSPAWSVGALALLTIAIWLLNLNASDGSDSSQSFTTSVSWYTWLVIAGLAVVLFAALIAFAAAVLVGHERWGLEVTGGRWLAYMAIALLLAVGVGWLELHVGATEGPTLPVSNLPTRLHALLLGGLIAGTIWVTVAWLAHDQLRALSPGQRYTNAESSLGAPGEVALASTRVDEPSDLDALHGPLAVGKRWRRGSRTIAFILNIDDSPAPATAPATTSRPTAPHDEAHFADVLKGLRQQWSVIKVCVGAFAAAVVAALATTGAMRGAYLSIHPECTDDPAAGTTCQSDFPATNVLLYGAAFAVLLTIIALPLVITWRARATQLVAAAFSIRDTLPDEEWVKGRERLEKILQLDTPILRNPLIALSIFTPLITSTLAAFIPQLANS